MCSADFKGLPSDAPPALRRVSRVSDTFSGLGVLEAMAVEIFDLPMKKIVILHSLPI